MPARREPAGTAPAPRRDALRGPTTRALPRRRPA